MNKSLEQLMQEADTKALLENTKKSHEETMRHKHRNQLSKAQTFATSHANQELADSMRITKLQASHPEQKRKMAIEEGDFCKSIKLPQTDKDFSARDVERRKKVL